MSTSLNDLVQPLTVDEAKASIYSVLAATGVTTTQWKPGAVVRTIIAAVAILVAALSRVYVSIAQSAFLELAVGDWLSLLAANVYGVTRIEATFATGAVRIDNNGGGAFNVGPGEQVFTNSDTGKTYTNIGPITLNPLEQGVLVDVIAVEAGSASTALAGQIGIPGIEVFSIVVTNTAAIVGTDAESDAALRTRCRAKLGALSPNGPQDAYRFAALNATRLDGSPIGVTHVRVFKDGVGGVDVYVADDDGEINGDPNVPVTDLGAVDVAIQSQAAPLAVTARTHSAETLAFDVSYHVWLYNTSGLTTAEIAAAISAELLAFFIGQPIGGNVIPPLPGRIYKSTLEAVICRARTAQGVPIGIFRAVVDTPAADTDVSPFEKPVLGITVPLEIVQVDMTEAG